MAGPACELFSTLVNFVTLPLSTANYRERLPRTLLALGINVALLFSVVLTVQVLTVLPDCLRLMW
jgi:penicillin-binding protein 1A